LVHGGVAIGGKNSRRERYSQFKLENSTGKNNRRVNLRK